MNVKNTYSGKRVSLIQFVEYAAEKAYGLTSLSGVKVDIWGDGMMRGRTEVTRLCFRILDFPDSQSRNHIYTFCVFIGKDNRINLERNCGTEKIFGDDGWLKVETRHLVQVLGVKLTLSGDTPFLAKLVSAADSSVISFMGIWIPDPDMKDLNVVLRAHGVAAHTYENRKFPLEPSKELVNDLRDIDGITPRATDTRGYRTGIQLKFRKQLPKDSLIHVESATCICPDACHAASRQAEKDVKLISEYILEKKTRLGGRTIF